jgi:hypothetical protein
MELNKLTFHVIHVLDDINFLSEILYDSSINPTLKFERDIVKNRIKYLIVLAKSSGKTTTFTQIL